MALAPLEPFEFIQKITKNCHVMETTAFLYQEGRQTEPLTACADCLRMVYSIVLYTEEEEDLMLSIK